jgi:thiamine-phosphate pyrophosphorylase
MLVLLSAEKPVENEQNILRKLFSMESSFLFHYRRPNEHWGDSQNWLNFFTTNEISRIVIHQNHELAKMLEVKGLHATETIRKGRSDSNYLSTSFHSLDEAQKNHHSYPYFFCSPVFQSISKEDYSPKESWDISFLTLEFKSKAFALGGINVQTISLAKNKGFINFAVLGAVWQSPDRVKSFQEIIDLCL